jgi:Flp pilus assembly protein TadB
LARSEDEDEFAAIVGRIGEDEDQWYRSRARKSFVALLVGSALVVVWLVVWRSAWGAVVGLPLMAAADLVWIVTLRRARRWRRSS